MHHFRRSLLTVTVMITAEFTGPSCGLCDDPAFSDVRRNDKADLVQ